LSTGNIFTQSLGNRDKNTEKRKKGIEIHFALCYTGNEVTRLSQIGRIAKQSADRTTTLQNK